MDDVMKKGKTQARKDILASVLEHARGMSTGWNFTGTPTPLDELWPIK